MKKIFFTLLAITIILFSSNLYAGCWGACLSTYQSSSINYGIDTSYLDQNGGSVTMYATYSSCCEGMMGPDVQIVWYKDGVLFDTTDIFDADNSVIGLYKTIFIATEPGLYEVFFINFQGANYVCGKVCVIRTEGIQSVPIMQPVIPQAAGITNEEVKNGYRIYPNPSSEGYFYIDYLSDLNINNIEIYNIGGQKILSIIPNGSEILNINTSDFRPGMYIIRIDSEMGITNEKILVN